MSTFSKDQITEMIQQYDTETVDDIKNTFKSMIGVVIVEIMEAELDRHFRI